MRQIYTLALLFAALLVFSINGASAQSSYSPNGQHTNGSEFDYWSHHRYTPYISEQSPLSLPESEYLTKLFMLAELAMKNRIDAQRFLGYGDNKAVIDTYNYKYNHLLDAFAALPPPNKKTAQAQELIKQAMDEQAFFLNEWANAPSDQSETYRKTFARHKDVQSSHRKLIQAYNILMRKYPHETANNKQAFFDFLCAMDFI